MAALNPAKPAHYLDVYRDLFARHRFRSVVELGVHKGDSLRLWHSLGAVEIVGVDTNLDMVTGPLPGTVSLVEGDASDPGVLAGLSGDLVVDDASHRWDHQQASYAALAPRARVYVIEDLDLCYSTDPAWHHGRNTAEWLGDRLRDLHTGASEWTALTFHRGLVVFSRT